MLQPSELRPSDLVGGRYRLIELVGSGAMGSVWAAHNEMTERKFALKVMNEQAALDPSAVQRFLQEARAAGSLRHPAIVEVYDVGNHESPLRGGPALPYLVMELLEGETLEERLVKAGPLPAREVFGFLRSLAGGLAVAHKAGIVHRDLKPANLFFHGPERVAKVLDFGISKLLGLGASDGVLTVAGLVLGSPPYMSPEQASGKLDVDARSDVWALGVIAYRSLSGRLPFVAPNYNALMAEIIHTQPEPIQALCPGLDPALAALVMSCLKKDRASRPADAGALESQLGPLLEASLEGPRESRRAAPNGGQVRLPRPWLLGGVAVLGSMGLAVAYLSLSAPAVDSGLAAEAKPNPTPRSAISISDFRSPPQSETMAKASDPPAATSPSITVPPPGLKKGAKPTLKPGASRAVVPSKARALPSTKSPLGGPPPVNEGVTSPGL